MRGAVGGCSEAPPEGAEELPGGEAAPAAAAGGCAKEGAGGGGGGRSRGGRAATGGGEEKSEKSVQSDTSTREKVRQSRCCMCHPRKLKGPESSRQTLVDYLMRFVKGSPRLTPAAFRPLTRTQDDRRPGRTRCSHRSCAPPQPSSTRRHAFCLHTRDQLDCSANCRSDCDSDDSCDHWHWGPLSPGPLRLSL
jgi:hypothetical protein